MFKSLNRSELILKWLSPYLPLCKPGFFTASFQGNFGQPTLALLISVINLINFVLVDLLGSSFFTNYLRDV